MNKWLCKICGYIHEGEYPPDVCPVCQAGPEDFRILEQIFREKNNADLKKVIIIGNGAAGMEAARTIREGDAACEILIFSRETNHFYSRIHLSTFIGNDTKVEELQIHPPKWYQEKNIRVNLNETVTTVFPEKKIIEDSHKNRHPYDKLIIATGAKAFMPPIPGIQKNGIVSLRTIDDALHLRESARRCDRAVILGGGILGLEAASSLNKAGLQVSVVEMSDHLMPSQLDRSGSEILQHLLEQRGIRFYMKNKVKEFKGRHQITSIELEDRSEIPAQLVIVAAGIRPNIELVRQAGIQTNRGILVNNNLETSHPDIYAVGDAAEFLGIIYGTWSAATEQGTSAAHHILGKGHPYIGSTPLHILKVTGVELTTVGKKYAEVSGEKEIIHNNPELGQYIKLIHNNRYLSGAIVLGMPGIGFRLEKLIKKQIQIPEFIPYFNKADWSILRKKKLV